MKSPARLLFVLLIIVKGAESARILLCLPIAGKSMKNVFYGMGTALSDRGHEVLFFNPYKPSSPVKGIKEIVPEKLAAVFAEKNFPNLFQMKESGMQEGFNQFFSLFVEGPRVAMETEEFDHLLKDKFDMIIFGPFAYAFYSIPYLMKIPFAVLTPVSYFPLLTSSIGNPTLPALSPVPLTSFGDQMTFFERVQNLLAHFMMTNVMGTAISMYGDRLVTQKFGEGVVPPSKEIERNMSVLFQSSNPIIDYHHPQLPNVIEVGGLHCTEPKPLPKHLQDFLGDSEFIYFSLGSVARPEDMPKELRATILEALGLLPFKVLLKWDTTDRTGIPSNILPSKWLPQQDVLGNGRCRLFISHGGFASVLESICHGVPLVTIPLTGDHQFNAANAARLGVAVQLGWETLTSETLTAAVRAALAPQLQQAVSRRRQLLAEQLVSPQRLAVHWVEHVIRYGGAPHLRSVGADLYWFQYYSLDVLAFLLVVLALLVKLLVLLLTCCCRCLCGRKRAGAETSVERVKRD